MVLLHFLKLLLFETTLPASLTGHLVAVKGGQLRVALRDESVLAQRRLILPCAADAAEIRVGGVVTDGA